MRELGALEPLLGGVADERLDLRADVDRREGLVDAVHVGDEWDVLDQRPVARLCVLELADDRQPLLGLAGGGGDGAAQADLGHHGCGEALGDLDLRLRPLPGTAIDEAERAHHLSLLRPERDPEVGADPEAVELPLIAGERMRLRVGDDERVAGGDDVPADRPRERGPFAWLDLGQTRGPGEDELVRAGVGQRDERRRASDRLCGEVGKPVERLVDLDARGLLDRDGHVVFFGTKVSGLTGTYVRV